LCLLEHEIDCKECPFVTCNNHPLFYLALQCAVRAYEKRAAASARARGR